MHVRNKQASKKQATNNKQVLNRDHSQKNRPSTFTVTIHRVDYIGTHAHTHKQPPTYRNAPILKLPITPHHSHINIQNCATIGQKKAMRCGCGCGWAVAVSVISSWVDFHFLRIEIIATPPEGDGLSSILNPSAIC
mmetsp:Transcript_17705/g.43172  ORF Transcript_17705/g.43172 Transcript_17705/m.43172 type:complete len:136 (-) Transcript_17705:873-1280(-)